MTKTRGETRGLFAGALGLAAVTLTAAAGCNGSALPGGRGTGGVTGTGGFGGEGGLIPPPPPPRACSGAGSGSGPGPAMLQLIDAQEYDNSIHTLLPLTTDASPPSVFPWRSSWSHDYPQYLAVTAVGAETYLNVAGLQAWAQKGDNATALLHAGCQTAGVAETETMKCAGGLATLLGSRAYRRPLFDEEQQILVDAFSLGFSDSIDSGVIALVMSVLQAPQFVYRVELGDGSNGPGNPSPPTPYELAARLSALLLDDLPDEPLRAAAAAGQLRGAAAVEAQVKRLLADPRAHSVSERFYRGWLPNITDSTGALQALGVERDPMLFPTFTTTVRTDMTREILRFVEHHFWETDSDLPSLLTAPYTFVTPTLAQHYGLTVPAGADPTALTQVSLDATRRGGLLTQGALMAGLAHYASTSPVQRGKFVVEAMLCMALPPPPPTVPPVPDLPPPNATTRQVLETYTSIPECATCHHLINPVGFTFEHFDAVGRWQDFDHAQPIDSSAVLDQPLWTPTVTVANATELASVMARSDTVRQCVVRTWFRFAFGRPADDNTDRCVLEQVDANFRAGGSHLRDLLPLLTTSPPYLSPSRGGGGNPI